MKTPTQLQRSRLARLLPGGAPRYVRCYEDKAAQSFDRFTVCYTGRAATMRDARGSAFQYVGVCGHGDTPGQPCDTQGEIKGRWYRPPAIGRKGFLGTRIPFSALPDGLRATVLSDYREIWKL